MSRALAHISQVFFLAGDGQEERRTGQVTGGSAPWEMASTKSGEKAPPRAHVDKVRLAMEMLASGKARTKDEARELAGLGNYALTPKRLGALIERNPGLRESLAATTPALEHSAECVGEDGKPLRVTLRMALQRCADSSVVVLWQHGVSGVQGGDENASKRLKMAKTMIQLCQACGLWAENTGNTMPAEIEAMERRQADTMSVESVTQVAVTHWTRDHRRHDGIGPTARRLHAEAQMLAQTPVVEADAQVE